MSPRLLILNDQHKTLLSVALETSEMSKNSTLHFKRAQKPILQLWNICISCCMGPNPNHFIYSGSLESESVIRVSEWLEFDSSHLMLIEKPTCGTSYNLSRSNRVPNLYSSYYIATSRWQENKWSLSWMWPWEGYWTLRVEDKLWDANAVRGDTYMMSAPGGRRGVVVRQTE